MAKEKEEREQTEAPLAEPVEGKKSKIIKKGEDAPVEYTGIPEEERCLLCGKNRKAQSTEYCPKCLQKLKKKKPPVIGWLLLLPLIAAAVVAFALGFMNFAPAKCVAEGKAALSQTRLDESGEAYGQAFDLASELNSEIGYDAILVGKGIYKDFAKTAGDPLAIGYAASQYLTEKQIAADPELAKAAKLYQDYQKAYTLVAETLTAVEEGTMEPDKAVMAVQGMETGHEDLKMWLLYYQSYIQVTFGNQSYLTQLENLKEIEKLYPEEGWFYNNMLRNCLYTLGRYDECLTYCDREIAANRNATDAYLTKLRVAMMRNDRDTAQKVMDDFKACNENEEAVAIMNISFERVFGSLDNAISICNSALGNGSASVELNRQLAVNYLAQHDFTKAYEAAYNAYTTAVSNYSQYGDSTQMTSALFETVFVCTTVYQEQGDGTSQFDGDVMQIIQSFAGYEEQATETSLAIIDGTADPADVLTKGTGDLI